MDNSAAVFIGGTDGNHFRTTTDSGLITAATLLTVSPGTPGDVISWTPSQVGDFWYTCTVTSHPDMAGKITVIPEPSAFALIAGGFAFAALRRRRGFLRVGQN
jgi:hypothetical protein